MTPRKGTPRITPPSKETLEDLYSVQGLSSQRIADIFGVARSTATTWIHAYGIPVHPIAGHSYRNRLVCPPELAKRLGLQEVTES